MIGYVYIMINTAFPDLIKIGRTVKKTEDRASELYTTGTPGKFIVIYELLVDNCIEIEKKAHELLADKRYSENREFFKVTPKEAIDLLQNITHGRTLENDELQLEIENTNSIFEGELVKYYLYCAFVGYKNKKFDDKSNFYRLGIFTIDRYEDTEFDYKNNAVKIDSWNLNHKIKVSVKESLVNYYNSYENFCYKIDDVRFVEFSDIELILDCHSELINKNYKNKFELILQKEIKNYIGEEEEARKWSLIYDNQTLISKYTQGWDDGGAALICMSLQNKLEELINSILEKSKKIKENEKMKNIQSSLKSNF
jgi:hypothetical protein